MRFPNFTKYTYRQLCIYIDPIWIMLSTSSYKIINLKKKIYIYNFALEKMISPDRHQRKMIGRRKECKLRGQGKYQYSGRREAHKKR